MRIAIEAFEGIEARAGRAEVTGARTVIDVTPYVLTFVKRNVNFNVNIYVNCGGPT